MVQWNPVTRRHYTEHLPQLYAAEVSRDETGEAWFRIRGLEKLFTSDQALRVIRVADLDLQFIRNSDYDVVFGTPDQVPHFEMLWDLLNTTALTTGYAAWELVLHFREQWPDDLQERWRTDPSDPWHDDLDDAFRSCPR